MPSSEQYVLKQKNTSSQNFASVAHCSGVAHSNIVKHSKRGVFFFTKDIQFKWHILYFFNKIKTGEAKIANNNPVLG